jgi:prophage DNA circulation protein
VKLDKKTDKLLDGIANRISGESDPLRKKRLVAHYRTIRQLANIKQMAKQLSPNQRKLWRNVLGVLENTALTHQQVLMGTEVLFAQFEATAGNLKEYQDLIETVDGASRLLGVVKGLGQSGQGLAQFSRNMTNLQKRMNGFNTQLEGVLEDKMVDLEAQSEAISSSVMIDGETGFEVSSIDDELNARLEKLDSNNAK